MNRSACASLARMARSNSPRRAGPLMISLVVCSKPASSSACRIASASCMLNEYSVTPRALNAPGESARYGRHRGSPGRPPARRRRLCLPRRQAPPAAARQTAAIAMAPRPVATACGKVGAGSWPCHCAVRMLNRHSELRRFCPRTRVCCNAATKLSKVYLVAGLWPVVATNGGIAREAFAHPTGAN